MADKQDSIGKHLSTLPPACVEMIGKRLSMHYGKNYRDLASMLGYSHHEVEIFEVNSPSNPGYEFLKTWLFRKDATTTLLRYYLKKMERDDIISLLDSEMSDPTDFVIILQNTNGKKSYKKVHTEGSMTIRQVLESRADLRHIIGNSQCRFHVLDQQASIFKGKELVFEQVQSMDEHDDEEEDDTYLTTALVGYDADEKIDGYHPNAVSAEKIKQLLTPFWNDDGTYIIRPSREDPSKRCISVVSKNDIINYRIKKKGSFFCLYEDGPTFRSLSNLVAYYKQHPIHGSGETWGPTLMKPVTSQN